MKKILRRRHELKEQLIQALDELLSGPGSGHIRMSHVTDTEAKGNIYRVKVGKKRTEKHRLIYRVYQQEMVILPLLLSKQPRNVKTYRDWEDIAMAIYADFDSQDYERFHSL